MHAVYGPDGNPQLWHMKASDAPAEDALIDVRHGELQPQASSLSHSIEPTPAPSPSHTQSWFELYADTWTVSHRQPVATQPPAPRAKDNAAEWALWVCIGPLLLLNAAFAHADSRRVESVNNHRMRKASALERRQLASRDIDCKRLLAHNQKLSTKPAGQMRRAQGFPKSRTRERRTSK